jgi:hypothetical protein
MANFDPRLAMSSEFERLLSFTEPLVLYVGPELSHSAGLPTQRALVVTLLAEAQDYLSPRQRKDLEGLVEADELGDAITELEHALTAATFGRIVERELDDRRCELPAMAKALAALGPRLRGVITPNLDHLLERAFEGTLAVHAQPVADLASRREWLFKIHGTLRDRATWVLTEDQRGRVLYRDPLHRQLFSSLFLAHPILFVGTRLDDPVLEDVVEQIAALAQGQPPRHWALVPEDAIEPRLRKKFAKAGINLIGYANDEGCIHMLGQLASRAPQASPAEPEPAPKPARGRVRSSKSEKLTVLFVSSNPPGTDRLALDHETKFISQALERCKYRDNIEFKPITAATPMDLQRALLEGGYEIVHISGHGEREGLILAGEQGEGIVVPKDALARLLGRCAAKRGLRCVVMNACWSLSTGELTAMNVPITIAMEGPINDVAALKFSRGFYDALGAGLDFADAYEEGMSAVDLEAPGAKFDAKLLEV